MNKRLTQARIRRGIKRFNQTVPRWRVLVDADCLDLRSLCDCPAGQVFGDFENALDVLGLDYEEAKFHGLALDVNPEDERYDREYGKLTELWKDELQGWGRH